MTDFRALLRALVDGGVEFIVIGGVAATIHGSARLTQDIDLVYRRARPSLERLVRALVPLHPYLRGVPLGLPFALDVRTLESGLNFTLTTDVGDVDLFGEVSGGGRFEALAPHTVVVKAYGLEFHCVDLPTLLDLKRAAGRPKDLEAIAELERLLEPPDDS